MRTVVYIDVLFIVNLILDYMILLCSALISGATVTRLRFFGAAVLAAFSSFIILAPPMYLVLQFLYKILTAFIIVFTAFGWHGLKVFLKRFAWYMLLNILLAGVVVLYMIGINANGIELNNMSVYFNISPIVLILCIVAVYLIIKIITLLFCAPVKQKIYPIKIKISNKEICANTFWDTGFRLRDCMTQGPVIMLSVDSMRKSLPSNLLDAIDNYIKSGNIDSNAKIKLHLIPAETPAGQVLLPAVKAEWVKSSAAKKGKNVKNITIAFTNQKLEEGYNALAGNEIMTVLCV